MVPVRRNQNWLPSIFNDFLNNDWLVERRNTTAPAVNIIENDDEYKIEVAAPGMTREDFKVHINEDNELIISMEKRSEEKERRNGTREPICVGSFPIRSSSRACCSPTMSCVRRSPRRWRTV